jgi:hypothetical protein
VLAVPEILKQRCNCASNQLSCVIRDTECAGSKSDSMDGKTSQFLSVPHHLEMKASAISLVIVS